jgi:putative ABC transport system permease protein
MTQQLLSGLTRCYQLRPAELLREASVSAVTQRAATALIVLVATAMSFTALLTAGRSSATESDVQQRLLDAGSRLTVIRDAKSQGIIGSAVVRVLQTSDDVTAVLALSQPEDAASGVIGLSGERVPLWLAQGDLRASVQLTSGRWPSRGEAIAGPGARNALAQKHSFGWVVAAGSRAEYPVVGTYEAKSPFQEIDAGLVALGDIDSFDSLYVLSATPRGVPAMQALAISVIGPADLDDLAVESSVALAVVNRRVLEDLRRNAQYQLSGLLAVGGGLASSITFADALLRRREMGRRRVLGARRLTLLALVVLRVLYSAAFGAILGGSAGVALTLYWGVTVSWEFAASAVVLSTFAAVLGSVAPAVLAAHRDPVAVLRST